MAKFKVGDRVRLVHPRDPRDFGLVGTIVQIFGAKRVCAIARDGGPDYKTVADCVVAYDDLAPEDSWGELDCLEPLTPPHQKQLTAEDVLSLEGLPDFKIPVRVAA